MVACHDTEDKCKLWNCDEVANKVKIRSNKPASLQPTGTSKTRLFSLRSLHLAVLLICLLYLFYTGSINSQSVTLPLLFNINITLAFVCMFILGWLIAMAFSAIQMWRLRRKFGQMDRMINKLNYRSAELRGPRKS